MDHDRGGVLTCHLAILLRITIMRSLFFVAFALILLSTRSLCTQHTSGVRTSTMATTEATPSPSLPEWYTRLKSSTFVEKLNVREWQDETWRQSEGGWKGKD